MKICSEEGCQGEVVSKELCAAHYTKVWRATSNRHNQHRKAAGRKIGRHLFKYETVIFVDGDSTNLDHDNLLVMNRSERAHYLKAQKSIKMTGAPGHNPCSYCKKWEPLLVHPRRYHNECILKYRHKKRGYV